MIADMHRARHLAWELPKLGWQVEILAPDATYQPACCLDADSSGFFPPDTPTHSAGPLWPGVFRAVGFGTIGWRALVPMARLGQMLLRSRHFDLVYVSTAQFPLFLLGPYWQRRIGVPYVLDFHDPCYREDEFAPMWARPSMKHRAAACSSRYVERRSVADAAAVVSVSSNYIDTLRRRYAHGTPAALRAERTAIIPFAVRPDDLADASSKSNCRGADTQERAEIVYVGAGGPVMERSFSLLCRALARVRVKEPRLLDRVRVILRGTMLGWQEGQRRHLMEIAQESGLDDVIAENPLRVSYRRSLELLSQAQGALVLGADDPGYMPSKLFSYALSGKPLLASLHRGGPAFGYLERNPILGHAVWFGPSGEMPDDEAAAVVATFLRELVACQSFDRRIALEPFLARSMARRHAALFDACLGSIGDRREPIGLRFPATAPAGPA
jgi:Glycosyl transferase 4-like domain